MTVMEEDSRSGLVHAVSTIGLEQYRNLMESLPSPEQV
jgi:hypothetical protein